MNKRHRAFTGMRTLPLGAGQRRSGRPAVNVHEHRLGGQRRLYRRPTPRGPLRGRFLWVAWCLSLPSCRWGGKIFSTSRNPDWIPRLWLIATQNMHNFIMAGRDTTACAMSWATFLLTQHPAAEARMVAEVLEVMGDGTAAPTYEQVEALVFTEAVVMETLRLYPPVPLEGKYAVGDDILPNGVRIFSKVRGVRCRRAALPTLVPVVWQGIHFYLHVPFISRVVLALARFASFTTHGRWGEAKSCGDPTLPSSNQVCSPCK